MKYVKSLALVAAAVSASIGISQPAFAEVSANIGATSNYIWRGVTQSGDSASVSGGIDYSDESGFYAGTWVGSLTEGAGAETDFYLGYSGESGDFTYDVGYVFYAYSELDDINFGEIYASGEIANFGFGVAYTVNSEAKGPSAFDTGDIYYNISYSGIDLGEEFELGFTAGYYTFDVSSSLDYAHVQADISKGDFGFTVSKTESKVDNDLKFVVSWGTTF